MVASETRRRNWFARADGNGYVDEDFASTRHHPFPNSSSEAIADRVLGYHGTSRSGLEGILANGFIASANEYDWLGSGIYFFQDAPHRAEHWAHQMHDEPGVVRAEISLEGCLDLLDIAWFSFLNEAHDLYVARAKRLGLPLPRQTTGAHRLDCAVIDYAVDLLRAAGTVISSVRGAFGEGRSAFPNSALLDLSHVQIAVRDPSVILGIEQVARSQEPEEADD
jgi:hypothetical protein